MLSAFPWILTVSVTWKAVYSWPTNNMLSGDREWLIRPLSWVWKDIFFCQGSVTVSAWTAWLAVFRWQNLHVPCLMACVDMAPGERGQGGSHTTAGAGGWTARDGRADKQKAPSVFISVTFGRSAPITFPHAKQTASAAEGRAGKKKKKKKKKWQKQVSRLRVRCLYSRTHSTDGSGSKVVVRVGRALIKKKKKKKKTRKKTQAGVINHVSDALTHSWGSEMKGNG